MSPHVELLNAYDEYVAGVSAAHKRWLDDAGLYTGSLGEMLAVLVVDGQLAGHWRRRLRGADLEIQVHLLRELTTAESEALQDNADAYARSLGLSSPATVTFSR